MGKASTETAIVPISDTYAVAMMEPQDLIDVIQENLGGEAINPMALDRLKVPSGGMTVWMVPQLEGKDKPEEEIEGIIVYWRPTRQMWHKSQEDGGTSRPDCIGKQIPLPEGGKKWVGIGNRDGDGDLGPHECATCPYAEFGTALKGLGKKCQERRMLAVLTPGSILPKIISVPPTSLKPIGKFFLGLAGRSIPVSSAIVGLGLIEKKNAAGTGYAEIEPRFIRALNGEEKAIIRSYADQIRPVLERVEEDAPKTNGGGIGSSFSDDEDGDESTVDAFSEE